MVEHASETEDDRLRYSTLAVGVHYRPVTVLMLDYEVRHIMRDICP